MGLQLEQIDRGYPDKGKSHKWLKNQRNRKIRRFNKEEVPNIKYKHWVL